jgi:hypothetical protein
MSAQPQQQYLRNFRLSIGGPTGKGLQFDEKFKVTFNVRRGDTQTPNTADVTVYNLSDATANLIQKEFTLLTLQASYAAGTPQVFFSGILKQIRKGRESAKDTYVALTAADGDEAYNFSTMALTLAANSTPATGLLAIIQRMAKAGIHQPTAGGFAPTQFPSNNLSRGQVFYGQARDEMRQFCRDNNCIWSVQNGQINVVSSTSYIPGTAVLISPANGLIGAPEITQYGLECTVLLNPAIRIGQLIKFDSSVTINTYRYGQNAQAEGSALNTFLSQSTTRLNPDGMYYVMSVDYEGDTRDTPWYSHLTCLSVDATVPPSNLAPPSYIQTPGAIGGSIRRQ